MTELYDYLKESAIRKNPSTNRSDIIANLDDEKLSELLQSSIDVKAITDMFNLSQETLNKKNEEYSEQKKLLEKKFNVEIQKQSRQNRILESENAKLKTIVRQLESAQQKSIPSHIALFLIINAIIITLSTTAATLYYSMQLIIIDIYYVWCAFIISTTLFCTALRTLADWRKMLNEKK